MVLIPKIKRRKRKKNQSMISNYNDYSNLPDYITQAYATLAVNKRSS
jgi:hypothetical protein